MSKFEFGDIIRGAVIALGNDEPNEVPCVGIVIPFRALTKTILNLSPKKNWGILTCYKPTLNKPVTNG